MNIYFNMNRMFRIQMIAAFLLVTVTATAQRKHKRNKDNADVYQELAQVSKWNKQWPVQINLHFLHRSTPAMTERDSVGTDMNLYYDQHEFYMQAEGMEQIANDSDLVMVNNAARMIKVFPNNGLLFSNRANNVASFLPDTSFEKLSQRFLATMQEDGRPNRQIVLQSRDRISGTDLEKEVINVSYNAGNYQPLHYKSIRRTVAPVDSVTYSKLAEDPVWKGRLINSKSNAGQFFFVVKEQVTECRFVNINYEQKTSPVHVHDRVVKSVSGEYQPAKGFDLYNVSQE